MKNYLFTALILSATIYCLTACKKELQTSKASNVVSVTSAESAAAKQSALFIGGSDSAYCINAATGATIWSYKVPSLSKSIPCMEKTTVFFSIGDTLYAFNSNDGSLKWKSYTSYYSSGALCVANGKVYIHTLSSLMCFNATNGKKLWRAKISQVDGYQTCSSPTVVNATVYVGGNSDNSVYAFDAVTGAQKWRFEDFGSGPVNYTIIASPTVVGDKVFCTHNNGNTFALDTLTGTPVWSFLAGFTSGDGSYAAFKNKIYQTTDNLVCREQETGEIVWQIYLYVRDCFVADNTVYTSSNYTQTPKLYALDAGNGSILWTYDLPANAETPVKAGNILYFTSFETGLLYALDATTRNMLWTKNVGKTTGGQSFFVALSKTKVVYPTVSGMRQ